MKLALQLCKTLEPESVRSSWPYNFQQGSGDDQKNGVHKNKIKKIKIKICLTSVRQSGKTNVHIA